MEEKIREYEKYIEERTSSKLGPIEKVKLAEYHREMVGNFQHKRLIHLIIMLFFVLISLVLISGFVVFTYMFGFLIELIPFYALTVMVVILTIFYVKHYYFLENHVQGLYEYTKKIKKVV